ncbi:MAG: 30S ribosomal protein S17 [Candidatus Dojkabacteria bacterium]
MKKTEVKKRIIKGLEGKVVKLTGDQTIKVRVERKYPHKKYGKIIKEHKNYLVHNPDNTEVKLGQKVNIVPTKPISKTKSWLLVK